MGLPMRAFWIPVRTMRGLRRGDPKIHVIPKPLLPRLATLTDRDRATGTRGDEGRLPFLFDAGPFRSHPTREHLQ